MDFVFIFFEKYSFLKTKFLFDIIKRMSKTYVNVNYFNNVNTNYIDNEFMLIICFIT